MLQVNSFFIFYQKQIQGRNEPALYTSSIPSVAEGNTDILGSFHHLTVYRNKLGFHRHISQGIFSDLSVYHRNGVAELLVLEELRCVRAELRCICPGMTVLVSRPVIDSICFAIRTVAVV